MELPTPALSYSNKVLELFCLFLDTEQGTGVLVEACCTLYRHSGDWRDLLVEARCMIFAIQKCTGMLESCWWRHTVCLLYIVQACWRDLLVEAHCMV
jgi:hypothetical protein